MNALRTLCSIVILAGVSFVPHWRPACAQQSVSSDDISVADGLQLPTYGHVWALDTWKGTAELVRLKPPGGMEDQPGIPLKLHHSVEFKGETAAVRMHETRPTFFLRGVSGDPGRSDLTVVHLDVDGEHRSVTKEAQTQIKQQAKHADGRYPELIGLTQQRVGQTDWYRLSLPQALVPGEYALIPLPGSQGFAEGEIFDFAVDPAAPENSDPLRSEQYRDQK